MLKHGETSRQDTQRPPTSLLQKSLAPAKSVYSFLPVCDASPMAPSPMSFKGIASSITLYFPTHGALLCQNQLALVMCFTNPFLQLLRTVNEGWNQLSHPGCPTKREWDKIPSWSQGLLLLNIMPSKWMAFRVVGNEQPSTGISIK